MLGQNTGGGFQLGTSGGLGTGLGGTGGGLQLGTTGVLGTGFGGGLKLGTGLGTGLGQTSGWNYVLCVHLRTRLSPT